MPTVHSGLPVVWDDSTSSAYGSGPGSAAPSYTTDFIAATGAGGSDANELRIPVFTASTNDRVYTATQIFHDLQLPVSGNVTFKPHVHFTFISEPTTGRTVVWEIHYVYAKVGGQFAATVGTITGTAYTTTGSAEIRYHLVQSVGDIVVPVADCGPSMMFVTSVKLKSTSTIDSGIVGFLATDIHYQKGPAGTDTEFV
jgi:hypothetical protein